jgi:hypothetical protein
MLAFEFCYLRDERFFLFIQRNLLRFRRIHTFWRLTVSYEGAGVVDDSGAPLGRQLTERLREVFDARSRGICSWQVGANFSNVIVDDRDRFNFGFEYETRRAALTSSKMLVPSHLYERSLKELAGTLTEVERVLRPTRSDYRLEISFERQNPYFGFFVRNVPQELVRHFRCVFRTVPLHGAECVIEATESTILLNARDHHTLHEAAGKYLTLSDTLITSSGRGVR